MKWFDFDETLNSTNLLDWTTHVSSWGESSHNQSSQFKKTINTLYTWLKLSISFQCWVSFTRKKIPLFMWPFFTYHVGNSPVISSPTRRIWVCVLGFYRITSRRINDLDPSCNSADADPQVMLVSPKSDDGAHCKTGRHTHISSIAWFVSGMVKAPYSLSPQEISRHKPPVVQER